MVKVYNIAGDMIAELHSFIEYRNYILQAEKQWKIELKNNGDNIALSREYTSCVVGDKVVLGRELQEGQFDVAANISIIQNNVDIILEESLVARLAVLSSIKFNIAQFILGKVDDPNNITQFLDNLCRILEGEEELNADQVKEFKELFKEKSVSDHTDFDIAIRVVKKFPIKKFEKFKELVENIDTSHEYMIRKAEEAVSTLNDVQFTRLKTLLQKKNVSYHDDFDIVIKAAKSFNENQFEKFSNLVMRGSISGCNIFLIAKHAVELLNENKFKKFQVLLENNNISEFYALNAITDYNFSEDGFKKLNNFIKYGYIIGSTPETIPPDYIAYDHDNKTLRFYDSHKTKQLELDLTAPILVEGLQVPANFLNGTKEQVLNRLYEIDFREVGNYTRKDHTQSNGDLRKAIIAVKDTQELEHSWLSKLRGRISPTQIGGR